MTKKVLPKLVLIVIMVCAICATSAVVMAEPATPVAKTPVSSVNIMHLTDTHYIPEYYCYTGPLKENDFATKIKGDPKLMLESYAVLERSIEMIKEQAPDYVFLTGDITSNGEKQSLIDIANALRQVQNEVRTRATNPNPNFQVLVVPGNHDVFNNRHASFYATEDGKKIPASIASRTDFVKIFAGLGYPNMTDAEAKAFYSAEEWTIDPKKHLPYNIEGLTSTFVNSTNRADLEFEYFRDNELCKDVEGLGGLTYLVKDSAKKMAIVGFDSTLSIENDQRTEGDYTRENLDWFTAKGEELKDYTKISLGHHNLIPHFTLQEQYLPQFVTYGWEEVTERLASFGVRYSFTGHLHANDVESYVSFNNNTLYDIETAATISEGAGIRMVKIEDYGNGEQNLVSNLLSMGKADFSYLINKGLIPEGYEDCFEGNMVDLNKYITKKLFVPYLENMVDSFISTTKIYAKIDAMEPIDKNLGVVKVKINTKELVYALLDEINTKVLAGYTYPGDIGSLKEPNNKVLGYANELLSTLIKKEVVPGKALDELILYCYGQHLVGGEVETEEELPAWVKDGLAKMRSGEAIDMIVEHLLYSKDGLYPLLEKLLDTPLDFTKCKDDRTIKSIKDVVGLLKVDVDLTKVRLGELVPTLLNNSAVEELLGGMGMSINLKNDSVLDTLDWLLEAYFTDSVKGEVGSVIATLGVSTATDKSYDCKFGETTIHKVNKDDAYSILGDGKAKLTPTKANGRVPAELSMVFGEDPKSMMNFVWFTSQYAPHGDIEYKVKGANDWTRVAATSEIMPFSYPMFDLGLFSSKIDKNISRHNVRLTGLVSGTEYEFRVGDSTRDVWTEIGSFKTAPESGAFEVSIVADLQGMDNGSYTVAAENLMKSNELFDGKAPAFVINLGDFVDDGKNFKQWSYMLDTGSEYWMNAPMMPVVGNHEGKDYESGKVKDRKKAANLDIKKMIYAPFNFHFDMGGATLNTEKYYSKDYSGVHFVVIDTNDTDKSGNMNTAQFNWLKADLAKYTDKPVVVLMHKGIYASGEHANDMEIVAMRKQLAPVFYENKVDIAFQGHDHTYSESPRLDGEGNVAEDGVLYVTMGTMGTKCFRHIDNENVPVDFGQSLHDPYLVAPTMGKLAFDGTNLTYTGYILDKSGKFVNVREYSNAPKGGNMVWLYVVLGVTVGGAAIAGITTLIVKKRKGAKVDNQ